MKRMKIQSRATLGWTIFLILSLTALPVRAATTSGTCPANSFVVYSGEGVSVSAAFDGTNYLVGINQQAYLNEAAQLISPTGAPVGSLISLGRDGGAPMVAFDGTNYLMVWPDEARSDGINYNAEIRGQFIAKSGTLVGTSFVISSRPTGSVDEHEEAVIFDGSNYLVVYGIGTNLVFGTPLTQLAARFVSPAGAAGAEIILATGEIHEQAVAFNGTNYLVTWMQHNGGNSNDVAGVLLAKTGTLSAPFRINQNSSTSHNPLNVASDGSNFFVVWPYDTGNGTETPALWELHGRLVTDGGGFGSTEFTVAGVAKNPFFPFITFDGTNYLVAWTDRSNTNDWNIAGQFVSKTGTLVGSVLNLVTCTGNQALSPVVYGAGKDLVFWTDGITADSGFIGTAIKGLFVSVAPPTSNCPSNALTIASVTPNGSNGVQSISAAFDGTNYLVGIQGDQTVGWNISAQLVSATGTPIGSLISVGRTGGVPWMAFDGNNYLMVWADDANYPLDQVYGQFVSRAGALVGSPFPISNGAGSGESDGIAFDGTNYLVVYDNGNGDGTIPLTQLTARFVSKGGTVSNEMLLASGQLKPGIQLAAYSGSNYLVAWQAGTNGTTVVGRFISTTGILSAPVTIYQDAANNEGVAVSSDGSNFFVGWGAQSSTPNTLEFDGRVVTPAGGFLGSKFTIAGPGHLNFSFLAFDGTNYLATWTDQSNANDWNIAGQFVTKTGTLIGSASNLVTCSGNQALSPVVYGGGKDLVLWTDGITPNSYRGTAIKGLFISVGSTNSVPPAGGSITSPLFSGPQGLYDLTGDYTEIEYFNGGVSGGVTNVVTITEDMSVVQSITGAFAASGAGTTTVTVASASGSYFFPATYTLKGFVKSSGNSLQLSSTFTGKGKAGGVNYTESFTYNDTIDPSTGDYTAKETGAFSGQHTMKLIFPKHSGSFTPVDWSLSLTPATTGTKVTGTATVDLANGRSFPFTISGTTSKLTLTGTGTAKGAKLTVTMTGNHITGISGSLLGQKVNLSGL